MSNVLCTESAFVPQSTCADSQTTLGISSARVQIHGIWNGKQFVYFLGLNASFAVARWRGYRFHRFRFLIISVRVAEYTFTIPKPIFFLY